MTALHALAAPPSALPSEAPCPPPLVRELEATAASFLEPRAFFVSWQGVLTLAYRGFTAPLVDLKQRISAAHPSLPAENPGSKWPKTSLGCLREGQRLTPDALATLTAICREESAAFAAQHAATQAAGQHRRQRQHQGAGDGGPAAGGAAEGAAEGLRLAVDSAAVVLFECRSLERAVSYQRVAFTGGLDEAPPPAEELARVAGIVAEQDSDTYWFAASRDGNREQHYRAPHLGATLMHPLLPQCWGGEAGSAAAAAADPSRDGLLARGLPQERADREALLAAVAHFRARVDAALPGMYAWFSDASLHITLRAII